MTVAVISDVHGNLPALRTVLTEIVALEPDLLVHCGDLVSGPSPGATLEHLRDVEVPLRSVLGNADRGALAAFDGTAGDEVHEDDRWAGSQLTRAQRDWLASCPATLRFEVAGLGRVLACHGTPRDDDEILLEDSPASRVREVLAGVDADLVLCGNTHLPYDRRWDHLRIVNVGSVGWSYSEPSASWAVLDERGVHLRRTPYDLDAAEAEIRAAHPTWPRLEVFLANVLRSPPTEAEAAAVFRAREPR
jgi:putative phosphoesterase